MIQIAVLDDEEKERHSIDTLLKDWESKNQTVLNISLFEDGTSLLNTCSPGKYSIIFLDIYVGSENGIDVAKTIREKDPSCLLIFLTSSSMHRADAFTVHAFDYIEKPVSYERLSLVLNDALNVLSPLFEPFLELIKGKQTYKLLYRDIQYITSDLQYCQIFTGEPQRFRISFKELESILCEHNSFVTINRGILVNMDYVQSMNNSVCLLTDGSTFPMHTKKAHTICQTFVTYQFAKRTKNLVRRS